MVFVVGCLLCLYLGVMNGEKRKKKKKGDRKQKKKEKKDKEKTKRECKESPTGGQ